VATANAVLDVTQYVRINSGYNSILLESHRDAVRIVQSPTKPSTSNTAFHVLANGESLPFQVLDTNLWALAMSDKCRLTITESSKGAPISFADSAFIDAFGRLRVSQPQGVSENNNATGRNRDNWEEIIIGVKIPYTGLVGTFTVGEEIRGTLPTGEIAIGTITADTGTELTVTCDHNDFQAGDTITGQTSTATATVTSANTGADIQHDYNKGGVLLKVTSAATDSARRHQQHRNLYVPGKSHRPEMTFKIGTSTDLYFVKRDSTSGVLVTTKIHQNDPAKSTDGVSTWNCDKMDGSGKSGITLDPAMVQILSFDLQMLKVGRARCNFNIDGIAYKAHEFLHANKQSSPYIRNPSQPIQYSIHNDGTYTYKRIGYFQNDDGIYLESVELTSGSDLQLEEICCCCESEGGYQLPARQYSTPITWADIRAGISVRTPILAVRLKANWPGAGNPNELQARILDFGGISSTNDALIELCHMHDPYDITPGAAGWRDMGDSGLEYCTTISAVKGRPEHLIDNDIISAGVGQNIQSRTISQEWLDSNGVISQDSSSSNSQMFLIYATPRTGTADVLTFITVMVSG